MSNSTHQEQVKFWRDPTLNNAEMLWATYVTHSFARHTHEGYAIGVIEAGVEAFTYRGASHRAQAGDIVIIHPGEVHTGQAGVPEGWQYRMLYPDATLLQQVAAEVQESCHSPIPYFPQPVIRDAALAQHLRNFHVATETAASQLERDSRFLWTLTQLVIRHAGQCPGAIAVHPESTAMHRVRDYLHDHATESVSLKELAAIAQLTPLRLLRSFQRTFGLPPHAYLIQLRVAIAKQRLAELAFLKAEGDAGVNDGRSPGSIAEVAYEAGFTDQSHLNRHFKRLVGVTPRQYLMGCWQSLREGVRSP
ncbi:MAG: AraC family transcriptional regulator [Oculatellaceae cyanobacterium Prado106]|jgi:AraC-like DNA-binding protein|nr:AraC family transcriptional regulator [Oculatellaceae cyanobacterium Prado106]